jgi:glycosyltransferase involved in cell wall biosynthesis
MALISIISGCLNEGQNVEELYRRIRRIFETELPDDSFELIFIDNASTDDTEAYLRRIASEDSRVKVIFNTRNFGHIRPFPHAAFQTRGDAVIGMASDLEDPPELIPKFVAHWKNGFKIALGQKTSSEESFAFFTVRKIYYRVLNKLSDVQLVENSTGFGIYDRKVIEILRSVNDPYPYFRGFLSELGYSIALVTYKKPIRKRGFSKNNFYTLWDLAMLGMTAHSKIPLRLATLAGLFTSFVSLMLAAGYFGYKLLFWNEFQLGMAPLIIGMFLISAVQLTFVGVIGEYVGAIHTQMMRRPLVVERERLNFDA